MNAGLSKTPDRRFGIMHPHDDSLALEIMDLHDPFFSAVCRGEDEFRLAGHLDNEFRTLIDIAVRMPSYNDRFLPRAHCGGDVAHDDRLPEDCAVQYRPDRAVGAFPLLLQAVFFDPCGIRGNRGAFYPHPRLLDCVGGLDGDTVVGLIASFYPKIEIPDIDIQERDYQLLLYHMPDHLGHLVAVDLDDRILHFYRHVVLLDRKVILQF